MGYSFNGQCYEDASLALKAFNSSFPLMDGASINTLVSSSVAGSTITYSVSSRQWSSNTLASRTGTASLTACTDSYINKFDTLATQDILVGVALSIAFCIGIVAGYHK